MTRHRDRAPSGASKDASKSEAPVPPAEATPLQAPAAEPRPFAVGDRVWWTAYPLKLGTIQELRQHDLIGESAVVKFDEPIRPSFGDDDDPRTTSCGLSGLRMEGTPLPPDTLVVGDTVRRGEGPCGVIRERHDYDGIPYYDVEFDESERIERPAGFEDMKEEPTCYLRLTKVDEATALAVAAERRAARDAFPRRNGPPVLLSLEEARKLVPGAFPDVPEGPAPSTGDPALDQAFKDAAKRDADDVAAPIERAIEQGENDGARPEPVVSLDHTVCDGRTFTRGIRVWGVRHPMFDGTVEGIVEHPVLGVGVVVRWDEPLWVKPTTDEVLAEIDRRVAAGEPSSTAVADVLAADPSVSTHHPRTLRYSTEAVPGCEWKRGDGCRLLGYPQSDGYAYEVQRRSERRGDVIVRVSWSTRPYALPEPVAGVPAIADEYLYTELVKH